MAVPSRQHKHSGSQHLINRGFGLLHLVTPHIERFAGAIQREGADILVDMDIQLHVRILDTYGRPLVVFLHEMVGDGVLSLIGEELRMTEVFGMDDSVDREGFLRVQILGPIHRLNDLVDLIRISCGKLMDRLKNAQSGAASEISLIHHLLVAIKADTPCDGLNLLSSHLSQFLCQYILQALKGLGNHFKTICHRENLYICAVAKIRRIMIVFVKTEKNHN